MSTEFHWIAVAIVSIVSAARLTRLATYDDFPPVKWLRYKVYTALDKSEDWQKITYCYYCAAFWLALPIVGLGWYTDFNAAWWVVNGALAASYASSILVALDVSLGSDD